MTSERYTAAPVPGNIADPATGTREAGTITHPDKILYPDVMATKADVFAYYRRIAPFLLPYLRDRPITLERLPDGVGPDRARFWQKDTPRSYPGWIPRVAIPTRGGKLDNYTLVNDVDTLLYLVERGALTFHVWLSRVPELDRPDVVLFDLDPGRAAFGDLVEVTRHLHAILTAEGDQAFVKTSGKTGLHVLVPWRSEGGYDDARRWARGIAEKAVAAIPEWATLEIRRDRRGRRVYLDLLGNAAGHCVAAPYALRAVPGAPVSTPLEWPEVKATLDPARFNLRTIFRRLARRKGDPMAGLFSALARPGDMEGPTRDSSQS
jgi:bifunctional non-homologous end joining protein LigD